MKLLRWPINAWVSSSGQLTNLTYMHSRRHVYNVFVQPVMEQEHTLLVWSSASRTTLSQLNAVQHCAMNSIGPNCCLQRLELHRHVAALSFLFKLHCLPHHPILQKLLPPAKHLSLFYTLFISNVPYPRLPNTTSGSPIHCLLQLPAVFAVHYPLPRYQPGTTFPVHPT